MPTEDDLKRELRQHWAALLDQIRVANRDFSRRLEEEPLGFELDLDDDALLITVGERPDFAYSQTVDNMRLELDGSNRIVAITIERFSDYLEERGHSALRDLASALRHLHRFEVSPGGRSQEVERELRELIPA